MEKWGNIDLQILCICKSPKQVEDSQRGVHPWTSETCRGSGRGTCPVC